MKLISSVFFLSLCAPPPVLSTDEAPSAVCELGQSSRLSDSSSSSSSSDSSSSDSSSSDSSDSETG